MKRCKSLVALFALLTATSAQAQLRETFPGPKIGAAWTFALPGNNPVNTEDPANYTISGGTFNVNMENTYNGGYHNLPSITVKAGAPASYDIKFTITVPFNYPGETVYPNAGLIIYSDLQNYFQLEVKHNGSNNTNYPNTFLAQAGSPVGGYDNLTGYQDITTGPITYHINKTGTTITLSYSINGGAETTLATVSSTDTDAYKAAAYAFLSDLSSKHIGLYTDNVYNGHTETVTFSNFTTDLPLATTPVTDNFYGPKLTPLWSFVFPGGWPGGGGNPDGSAEDAGAYKVYEGNYVISASNGGLYGDGNYIRNTALTTVKTGAPSDYVIEVAADGTYNYPDAAETYPEYGLLICTNASNYFTLDTKHSGYTNGGAQPPANYNYANTGLRIGNTQQGSYDNFANYQNLGVGPVLYRIRKTGTSIALSYTTVGGTETTMATVSSTDDPASYSGQVYAFLSDLSSKHVGLYAAGGFGNGLNEPVSFSHFYTDLPLVNVQKFGDELEGSKLSSAWSFNVAGNNPVNTEDPANYTVADGFFNVNFEGNNFPNAINVPSVTVGTGNTGDWWVEAGIKAHLSGVGGYPLAMFTIFDDASNFFEFGSKHNSYNGNDYLQSSSELSIGGTYTDDVVTDYSSVTVDNDVVYRIVKSGGVYTLSYLDVYNEHVIATVDSNSTGSRADLYTFLNNIGGKHIGFIASQQGSGITETASFDYLRTSLNIATPAAVTGRIALEGVNDLSAISAGAPTGTFHVSFRTPGTTTEVYGADVTITAVGAGSSFGTYSITGVPNGTYDVAIKGSKSLRVAVGTVTVNGAATIPDATLPAGDANNDNTVNIGDFGVMVNAYETTYDPNDPNTGYDPAGDFNYDGTVNIGDFGLMVNEYGVDGAP